MAEENILACPFCGGVSLQVTDFDRIAQVECTDCGGRGPQAINDNLSAAQRQQCAIASWNRSSDKRFVAGAWTLPEDGEP